MTFSTAFQPATNKTGLSKLTFLGTDVKEGDKPQLDKNGNEIIDEETGEVKTRHWVIVNLTFDCMGVVRGTSQKVSITCSEKYSPDNLLGKTLAAMGYVPPTIATELDEDGFEVQATDLDDDEFAQIDASESGIDGIEEFLKSCENKHFTAKVSKISEGKRKGFWGIDVDTLKPFVKPEKSENIAKPAKR